MITNWRFLLVFVTSSVDSRRVYKTCTEVWKAYGETKELDKAGRDEVLKFLGRDEQYKCAHEQEAVKVRNALKAKFGKEIPPFNRLKKEAVEEFENNYVKRESIDVIAKDEFGIWYKRKAERVLLGCALIEFKQTSIKSTTQMLPSKPAPAPAPPKSQKKRRTKSKRRKRINKKGKRKFKLRRKQKQGEKQIVVEPVAPKLEIYAIVFTEAYKDCLDSWQAYDSTPDRNQKEREKVLELLRNEEVYQCRFEQEAYKVRNALQKEISKKKLLAEQLQKVATDVFENNRRRKESIILILKEHFGRWYKLEPENVLLGCALSKYEQTLVEATTQAPASKSSPAPAPPKLQKKKPKKSKKGKKPKKKKAPKKKRKLRKKKAKKKKPRKKKQRKQIVKPQPLPPPPTPPKPEEKPKVPTSFFYYICVYYEPNMEQNA